MIDLLTSILCVLQNILLAIMYAGVQLVNLLVAAIAAFLVALVSVLPAMPEAPDDSGWTPTALGWIAWFVPVGGIVAGLAAMMTIYFLFRLAQVALRWVKAL